MSIRFALALLIASAGYAAAHSNDALPRELGCVAPADLQTDYSPPELARVVRACTEAERFDDAIRAFYSYSMYGIFDQQRVRDESAHMVLQHLHVWIFAGYPRPVIENLKASIEKLRDPDSAFLQETCDTIRAVGPPSYRPGYMIRHGMWPRKHPEDWGHDDFDPVAAWEKALTGVNNCPPA